MTVHTRRARPAWRPSRVGVLVVACAAFALGPADPASAHGPTPDGTNFVGRVTAVVDPANATVPSYVDPAAAPRWRRVSDAQRWRWHDHRIHWMAPTPPPRVRDRPDVDQRVLEWTVPFEVDGDSFEVRGVLDYVSPALVVGVAAGLSRLSQLTSSHVVNALPAWAVRAVVAVSLMLAVPALLATRAGRHAVDDL